MNAVIGGECRRGNIQYLFSRQYSLGLCQQSDRVVNEWWMVEPGGQVVWGCSDGLV